MEPEKLERGLRFAVLFSYSEGGKREDDLRHVQDMWESAKWPLVLMLVNFKTVPWSQLVSRRRFLSLESFIMDKDRRTERLRTVPAAPWEIHDVLEK